MTKQNKYLGCYCCNSLICGIFFIVIGGYFLAKSLGWITVDLPFWPIVLIAIGLYLISKNYQNKTC